MNDKGIFVGEIFNIERGGSPRPIQHYLTEDTDSVPWIMIGDTTVGGKYIESTRLRIKKEGIRKSREVYPGELLLTNSMSFGRPYILKTYGCIHDGWLALKPKRNDIDLDYAYHALGSAHAMAQFQKQAAGATVKNLNKDIVASIKIPLPPLEEQRRIAAILDVSQKLQRLHRQRIESLYRLRQSMYRELFSQPCSDLLPLSSLAKITSGYAFKAADFCEQGAHVIRMSDLGGEDVDLASSALVPAEVTEGLERFELFEGDILLGMSGSLGKLGIVPCITAGARVFLNQRVAKISLLPSSPISRELLVEAIKSKQYIGHLERCAAGVAVRNVSSTQMLDFLIPVLTEEEGRAFSRGCRTVSAQILRSEHCIAQSRELQASLVEALLGQP
jgi:type I restriction enzyme S subunit